jgi:type II secretory pathway component PulF
MLEAGIPVRAAIDHVADSPPLGWGAVLAALQRTVGGGRTLAEGMEANPGAFARFEIEVVRAAEESGTLDRAARSLAATAEASERDRRRLIGMLAYPTAILLLVPVPLNIGRLMNGRFSDFVLGWLAFTAPIAILVAAAVLLLRSARGGGAPARALLRVPVIGPILRGAALVRWARAYAALDDAGVPADRAVERAAAATGIAAMEGPLASPAPALRAGISREQAFAPVDLPLELRAAIVEGEKTGGLAGSLRRAADGLEAANRTRQDAAMALLPIAATLLAGGAVLYAGAKIIGDYYGAAGR